MLSAAVHYCYTAVHCCCCTAANIVQDSGHTFQRAELCLSVCPLSFFVSSSCFLCPGSLSLLWKALSLVATKCCSCLSTCQSVSGGKFCCSAVCCPRLLLLLLRTLPPIDLPLYSLTRAWILLGIRILLGDWKECTGCSALAAYQLNARQLSVVSPGEDIPWHSQCTRFSILRPLSLSLPF